MTYIAKRRYYKLIFAGMLAVLAVLMVLSSTMGTASISFWESVKILVSRIPLVGTHINTENISSTHKIIITNIRMPRIVLSAFAGMGLAVVGAAFQGIFRNPMADPYVLGTSSGAALGASIGIVLQGAVFAGLELGMLNISLTTAGAFAGAVLTTLIVYNTARIGNRIPSTTLILAGVAMSFICSSAISLLMMFNRDYMEKIIFWTMGSFSAASWKQSALVIPAIVIGTIIITAYARDLNIMVTGTETAKSLGVDVEKVKKILLVISAVLVAVIVSSSGIIGFAGLVVPHIIRLIMGPDHRIVIPYSALAGAIFMVTCDTIARIAVPPSEIPVGVITSVLGAPFFIYLLISDKRKVAL